MFNTAFIVLNELINEKNMTSKGNKQLGELGNKFGSFTNVLASLDRRSLISTIKGKTSIVAGTVSRFLAP